MVYLSERAAVKVSMGITKKLKGVFTFVWKIDKKLYNRIRAHYDNRGGSGTYSNHFEKLPLLYQNEICSLTGLKSNGEDALIASYRKGYYMVVISNQKIYWLSSDNLIKSLALEKIKSVTSVFLDMNTKERCYLKMKTDEEEEILIKMEAEGPWSSIYNVLLLIINLRK